MTDLTKEESDKLIAALNKLKIKPKADTPEDLELWLKAYGAEAAIKKEPVDVETTKTVVSSTQQPRISIFYGDNVKGEATYAQWVYEVKCLLIEKTHKPEVIAQAIRRSLRGEASNLVRRLGIGATIPEILDKFKSVYGEVDSKEHLLAKFYSSKQEENESVTKWSCRLEDTLASAVERKLVDPSKVNDMLRNMFYQGLKPALKDICGYKFEQISDFDKLRVEIRKIEQDHLKPEEKVSHSVSSVQQTDEKSDIKEMKSMIKSLTNTVEQLEKRVNANQEFQGKSNQGYYTNRGSQRNQTHYRGGSHTQSQGRYNSGQEQSFQYQDFNQGQPPRQRMNRNQNNQYRNPNQGQGQNQRFNLQSHNQNQAQRENANIRNQSYYNPNPNLRQSSNNQEQVTDDYEENFNRGPLCFRCRQYGHYQWQCPVIMDHSRKYLN